MIRRLPSSTRTYTLFPSSTLVRSPLVVQCRASRRVDVPRSARPGTSFSHLVYKTWEHFGDKQVPCFLRASRQVNRRAGVRWMWVCAARSEEHTSELQSLMPTSYAVFCLKKKKTQHTHEDKHH